MNDNFEFASNYGRVVATGSIDPEVNLNQVVKAAEKQCNGKIAFFVDGDVVEFIATGTKKKVVQALKRLAPSLFGAKAKAKPVQLVAHYEGGEKVPVAANWLAVMLAKKKDGFKFLRTAKGHPVPKALGLS